MKILLVSSLILLISSCGSSNSSRGNKIVDPLDPVKLNGRWQLTECQDKESAFYTAVVDYNQDGKIFVIEQTYVNSDCLGVPSTNSFYTIPYNIISNVNNKMVVEYKYYLSVEKPKVKEVYAKTDEIFFDGELLVTKAISLIYILPSGKFETIKLPNEEFRTWKKL